MTAETREQHKSVPVDDPAHETFAHDSRQDEAQKSYHTILEQHIQQAQEELERPATGLFLSGLSAGLDLGFGVLVMATIATLVQGELSRSVSELLVANGYAVGFVFVVVGRSALFTEQTTSAVLPVLARRVGLVWLLRLWAIVLAANLIGATAIAAVISFFAPSLGIVKVDALARIAGKLLEVPWQTMLASAVAAGWLMGLLAWVVVAARDTISQIFGVWMTAFVIGFCGLHHSIAGTIELLAALFAGAGPTLADYARFIVCAVIGNALGGSLFVALLKFGHVHSSRASR